MAAKPAGVNPVPVAFQLARQGLSSNKSLIAAREIGVKIRDATWDQIYAQARSRIALQVGASAELLTGLPAFNQIGELRTKSATGYLQYASVYVRDRQTGIVSSRPYAVRGMELQTRGAVVNKALQAFVSQATPSGNYGGEQILGAAYTATTQMFPLLPGEEL